MYRKPLPVVILLCLACATGGCARLPPATPAAPRVATEPAARGVLADVEKVVRAREPADTSGFALLDSNDEGLRWRLALIDAAAHSLDLQYYLWLGDASGELLLERVIAAAERGVAVRIIVDDLSTMLADETHIVIRDRLAAILDSHPNIEFRLFNAWQERSLPGRLFDSVTHAERVNQRMHNKLLIADNRAAIIGGRNLGDHYFGLSREFNFRDLDVIGIGPVARQASGVFDRFWNSRWVTPAAALGIDVDASELARQRQAMASRLARVAVLEHFPLERQDWREALLMLGAEMHTGSSTVHSDSPDEGELDHHMPEAIRTLLASARNEVLIINAYVIPGEHALARIRAAIGAGVRYRLLTNSLASHDVPAVNAHYKQWRERLIDSGVEVHEMRPDAAIRRSTADTAPVEAEFMGLHAKAMAIDGERVLIGSMNLDPRSWGINSEMGVVIESPGLARALAALIVRDLAPENSWRVTRDADGGLRWIAGADVHMEQPARDFWQRIEDIVFMAFPPDLY